MEIDEIIIKVELVENVKQIDERRSVKYKITDYLGNIFYTIKLLPKNFNQDIQYIEEKLSMYDNLINEELNIFERSISSGINPFRNQDNSEYQPNYNDRTEAIRNMLKIFLKKTDPLEVIKTISIIEILSDIELSFLIGKSINEILILRNKVIELKEAKRLLDNYLPFLMEDD